jgi:hypothetical protein
MTNTLLKPGDYVNYFGEALIILELCEMPVRRHQSICYTVYDEKSRTAKHINPALFERATANLIDANAARRQVIKYFEPEEVTNKLKIFGFIQ